MVEKAFVNISGLQNQSAIKEILLLGFQNLHSYRNIIFLALLLIFLASVSGNLLIVLIVINTQHLLYSPMYFFLSQLSITDILLTTSICSTLLPAVWNESLRLPITGCLTQLFMFFLSTSTECFLLTTMSYDRYLAICKPLHYVTIMNFKFCILLTAFIWILGYFIVLTVVLLLHNLNFCDADIIDHFFCDFIPLFQLSCSDTTIVQTTVFLIGAPETGIESLFIIATYIRIFYTILRIPSSSGRQKAFSTCSSHLTVVCIYYGTIITVYLAPSRGNVINLNKSLSLLYTVTTPLLNPLIYSLKNKEIQKALQNFYRKSLKIM